MLRGDGEGCAGVSDAARAAPRRRNGWNIMWDGWKKKHTRIRNGRNYPDNYWRGGVKVSVIMIYNEHITLQYREDRCGASTWQKRPGRFVCKTVGAHTRARTYVCTITIIIITNPEMKNIWKKKNIGPENNGRSRAISRLNVRLEPRAHRSRL